MMYGRGKSDSAIVAAKLVNKAGVLAAESVERRAGAKGSRPTYRCRRPPNTSCDQSQDRQRAPPHRAVYPARTR
jgi:hypothetical protein